MSVRPYLAKRGAALLSLFSLLALSHVAAANAAEPWHVVSPKARHIYETLNSRTDIQFVDTPLRFALKSIASRYDVELFYDERYLNDEGISLDREIVNFEVKRPDLRLRQALKNILEPKGLAVFVRGDVIIVSTQLQRSQQRPLRLYNDRPLLETGETADRLAATLQDLLYIESTAGDGAESVPQFCLAPYRQFIFIRPTHDGHDRIVKLLDLLEAGLTQSGKAKEE